MKCLKYWLLAISLLFTLGSCSLEHDPSEAGDTETSFETEDTETVVETDSATETEGETDTETASETTDTETEEPSCINKICVNSDSKTHTDCSCHEKGFCVPDLGGIEVFWDPLTCTLDCTDNLSICTPGYYCVQIPDFVHSIYPDVFPGALCAVDTTITDTDSDTDEMIPLEWIEIPGGTFQMGSENGKENELPVHTVTLSSFQMLKSEVTVSQYKECVDDGSCSEPGSGVNATWPGKTNHPVNYVSWFQSKDFCEWLGGSLPSESEWEYAATNGGENILYPWGNSNATCETAVIKEEDEDGCGTGATMPVCSKTAGNTTHGLCDMSGNVWEWIQDWYHINYTGAPSDGTPWEDPEGTVRITRGGAFSYDGTYTIRYRNDHADPNIQFQSDGFRCVK